VGYNGTGTWSRLYNWVNDKNSAVPITASRMDAEFNDYANNGFGNTLTRDGQGVPTANLPMAGFRHTGVGNGVAVTDYATVGQVQNGGPQFCSAGGTANAITLSPAPIVAAYATGQKFAFLAANTNTGATTVNVSGLGAKNLFLKRAGGAPSACVGGEIQGATIVEIAYDGTRFQALDAAPSVQAWANVGSAGTVNAGDNVSSVTHSGTGAYSVNFTNQLTDANYAPVITCGAALAVATSLSTASFAVTTVVSSSGANVDSAFFVAVLR